MAKFIVSITLDIFQSQTWNKIQKIKKLKGFTNFRKKYFTVKNINIINSLLRNGKKIQ